MEAIPHLLNYVQASQLLLILLCSLSYFLTSADITISQLLRRSSALIRKKWESSLTGPRSQDAKINNQYTLS